VPYSVAELANDGLFWRGARKARDYRTDLDIRGRLMSHAWARGDRYQGSFLAVGALPVAVIESALRSGLMSAAGVSPLPAPGSGATPRAAVNLSPVAT